MSEQWQNQETLVQILIARTRPNGNHILAVFLVDLQCLGVKNAFLRDNVDHETVQLLVSQTDTTTPMMQCSPELAMQVISAGLRYARELGFAPHPDFRRAKVLLTGIEPSDDEVPLGGVERQAVLLRGPRGRPLRDLCSPPGNIGA
ncbi:MAG: hypothetical protein AAFV53_04825 [Myxococcota bacterium]